MHNFISCGTATSWFEATSAASAAFEKATKENPVNKAMRTQRVGKDISLSPI